jgi:hypothetical protein
MGLLIYSTLVFPERHITSDLQHVDILCRRATIHWKPNAHQGVYLVFLSSNIPQKGLQKGRLHHYGR